MPKIFKVSEPKVWKTIDKRSKAINEKNDCAPKAVAIATGEEYEKVLKMMADEGRVTRQGTDDLITRKVLKKLGYKMTRWATDQHRSMIDRYPAAHNNLQNITSHHFRRFSNVWDPVLEGKIFLFRTKGHLFCVRDGKNHDWSINSKLHVQDVFEVKKI